MNNIEIRKKLVELAETYLEGEYQIEFLECLNREEPLRYGKYYLAQLSNYKVFDFSDEHRKIIKQLAFHLGI